MTIAWYDIAGYVGVFLVVLAFLLLQAHKLHGNRWIYQLMNVLGAIGVILSLVFGSFNLPALLVEIAWVLIGIYGMAYNRRRVRDAREAGRLP